MSPLALIRYWSQRVLKDEDVFLMLLGARWLALLPPLLSLLLRAEPTQPGLAVFAFACASNLLLSVFYPQINRYLQRHPLLLGLDLVFVTLLIAGAGGTLSYYRLYAYTPLVLAAFFFQMRGGLVAAAVFTPLYLLAIVTAHRLTGNHLNIVAAVNYILSVYLVALIFGYSAMLLQRVKLAATELHQTQTDLARSETLAALGKMVGHLSHEIRNPLTTVGGYAYQILRKPDNAELVMHHAQIIADETRRLEDLLTDMLNLARPAKPSFHPVNLHELLDKACLLAGSQLQSAAAVKVVKQYDPQLPPIPADAPSLLRAFLNVIRNAIHFMPSGGTLTITTRIQEAAGHERRGMGERSVEITIADTGAGIPADVLPTIFTPFVTHRAGGTGLGLAVTQQVIEEHGGFVKAESIAGQGARFVFRLPLRVPNLTTTDEHK